MRNDLMAFNEFVGHVERRMLEIGCERDVEVHPEMPWLGTVNLS
jgi:hypothetical protein